MEIDSIVYFTIIGMQYPKIYIITQNISAETLGIKWEKITSKPGITKTFTSLIRPNTEHELQE